MQHTIETKKGKNNMNKHLKSILLGLIPIFIFFIAWQILSTTEILNPALFSNPTNILQQIQKLSPQPLLDHMLATFQRLILSFSLALILGISIGMIMGWKPLIYRFFDPLITTIMCIPGIAMAPIFIIWLGFGNPTIITIGTLVAFFPIVYNVSMGVRSTPQRYRQAAQIMGSNNKDLFIHIYLPHTLSHLIVGIKLGLARCWRTIIAVEFIAATSYGLGYMIWDAYEYLQVTTVYAGILLLAITFFAIEKLLIDTLEKHTVIKWGVIQHHD